MVKLEARDDRGTAWYFRTMEDCDVFKCVFRDRWCNVVWEKPIEADDFPEMSKYAREQLDEDPKQRAEKDLMWGFSLDKYMGREMTLEQTKFVAGMVDRLS